MSKSTYGLSLREQAMFLVHRCLWAYGYRDLCPYEYLEDFKTCPVGQDCENLSLEDWLEVLKKRKVPEEQV